MRRGAGDEAGDTPKVQRRAHVPTRRCAGCGRSDAKSLLRRMALVVHGKGLEWRPEGGRGTYLHPTMKCADLFLKGRKLLSGLRARVERAERERLLAAASFPVSAE